VINCPPGNISVRIFYLPVMLDGRSRAAKEICPITCSGLRYGGYCPQGCTVSQIVVEASNGAGDRGVGAAESVAGTTTVRTSVDTRRLVLVCDCLVRSGGCDTGATE
jgi:hypothetical protein